jgi:hypothetical protein
MLGRNSKTGGLVTLAIAVVIGLFGCGGPKDAGSPAPTAGSTAASAAASGASQAAAEVQALQKDPATIDFENKISECEPIKSHGGVKLFTLTKDQIGVSQLRDFKAMYVYLRDKDNKGTRAAFIGCVQTQMNFDDQQKSGFEDCATKAVFREHITHPVQSILDMLQVQLPTCYKKVAKIGPSPSPTGTGKPANKVTPSPTRKP